MRINNVKLINYRIHEHLEKDFSKGINLLLGPNGSGKSSILEAIGFAMFGVKGRSDIKDTVKNGEKSGLIKIEFTGNDGIEYIVEKNIGKKQGHLLYKKGDETEKLTFKDEIVKKIRNLSGINEDSDKVYESVIVASQNKITDIFACSSKERESIFNEIFDTQIYRNMYKNFTKDIKRKYEDAKIDKNGALNIFKESLLDGESIKIILKDKKIKFEDIKKKHNERITLKENAVIESEKLKKIQNEIKTLNDNLITLNESMKNHKNSIIDYENQLEIAKKDLEIVNQNKKDFDEYLVLSEKIKKQEIKKDEMQNIKNSIIENERKISTFENEINIMKTENKNKEKNILDLINEIKTKEIEIKEIEISLNEEIKKETALKKENDDIKKMFEEFMKLYKKDNELNKENEKYNILMDKFEKNKFNEIEIMNNRDREFEKLNELKNDEKENDIINIEIQRLNALINQNNEAKKELASGECPFLNEKCLNLEKENDNSINYFIKKEEKLIEEKNEYILKQDKFKNLKINMKEVDKKIINYNLALKNYKLEKDEYSINKNSHIQTKLLIENNRLLINNLFKINNQNLDLDLKKDELNNRLNIIDEKLKTLKIIELKKENEKYNKIKTEKDYKKMKLEKDIENNKKKANELNEEISNIIKLNEELQDKIKDFDQLKDEITKNKKEIETLEKGYLLYNKSLKNSKTVDIKFKNLNKLKKQKDEMSIRIIEKEKHKENLEKEFSNEKLNKIEKEIAELNEVINENNKKIIEMNGEIEVLKNNYKKYINDKEQIKILKNELNIISQKIELTNKFRNNINSMGKEVADYMLREIELKATDNFREITGRSEAIKWESNEKEAYAVYLVNELEKRSFTMLSGGEQVAVALSLRAALSTTLSNANFSIFDEPTNNLDKERKESLADSLNIILKGIEQSIIVTHDDTFKEMAENIIELY